jgi:hypothetical protein
MPDTAHQRRAGLAAFQRSTATGAASLLNLSSALNQPLPCSTGNIAREQARKTESLKAGFLSFITICEALGFGYVSKTNSAASSPEAHRIPGL